jgi:hypothetical protein
MDRRLSHPAFLIASLVVAAGIGIVVVGYYWFFATFELFDCVNLISDAPDPPSHLEGGQDSSVYAAAVVTASVWLAAWKLTTSTRMRHWPLLLVPIFTALDIAALLALWGLAPIIWGPEHCVPD